MRTSQIVLAALLFGCASAPPAPLTAPESEPRAREPEPPAERRLASEAPEPEPVPAEPPTPPDPPPPLAYGDAAVALAAEDAAANRALRVVRRLSRELSRIEQEAPYDERLVAYVLLARAHRALGQKRRSDEAYELARKAWHDTEPPAERDEIATRRLGRALEAVGEALFVAAEARRARAESLKPPVLSARASDDAVRRYLTSRIAPWVAEKRRRIEEASRAYRKVIELRPVPPPRWVVAAAASVGEMRLSFVEDFRTVTIPPSIRGNPELLQAYRDGLERALEPERQHALAAFRSCRNLARRYEVEGEVARSCEERLSALEAVP